MPARLIYAEISGSRLKRPIGRLKYALFGFILVGFASHRVAVAQTQNEDVAARQTVSWAVSVEPVQGVKRGGHLALTLHGVVRDGWHVYSLKQLPGGPTPLLVALDQNAIATAAGAPFGSPATKIHDKAFNLETQFYSHLFTVTLPVRIGSQATPGPQQVPVSVRFQTCNDRVCQPPKTVHLSAPISIQAEG